MSALRLSHRDPLPRPLDDARIAVFTDDPGWHGERLRRAFAARGREVRFVSLQRCHFDLAEGTNAVRLPGFETLPAAAFVRGIPGGTLEEVVFYLDILHALRLLGVRVYNDARAIERSVDKGMTSFLLSAAGIPTPPAWVIRDPAEARRLIARESGAGHELVLKPLFGSQGEGLMRLAGGSENLPEPTGCNGVYYLQRYIPTGTAQSQDWRVFVIGGRAVTAMCRRAQGWITNVARGAICHPAVLDPELKDFAEAAAETLAMDYAGVDILRGPDGRTGVIEVNGIPAWKGLQQVCGMEIAEALVADVLRRLQAPTPLMEIAG